MSARKGGLLACCNIARSMLEKKDVNSQELEEYVQNFKMKEMAHHPRSSQEYRGSTKGSEVGARNEAAYINYTEIKPKTLTGIFAMPGLINLLTVVPLYCFLLCLASAGWGIFYWDLYCRKHYECVLIARPNALRTEKL
ncbi:unnamed protein product [Phytomonas sp. EM1]|nr:unnamed protein product [Phytomonas sp. EM1]|eukprot:CCW61296.1 unnamed protein product [Phytomonas sp. isolate EM1]